MCQDLRRDRVVSQRQGAEHEHLSVRFGDAAADQGLEGRALEAGKRQRRSIGREVVEERLEGLRGEPEVARGSRHCLLHGRDALARPHRPPARSIRLLRGDGGKHRGDRDEAIGLASRLHLAQYGEHTVVGLERRLERGAAGDEGRGCEAAPHATDELGIAAVGLGRVVDGFDLALETEARDARDADAECRNERHAEGPLVPGPPGQERAAPRRQRNGPAGARLSPSWRHLREHEHGEERRAEDPECREQAHLTLAGERRCEQA